MEPKKYAYGKDTTVFFRLQTQASRLKLEPMTYDSHGGTTAHVVVHALDQPGAFEVTIGGAICSPQDQFQRSVGAKLAHERAVNPKLWRFKVRAPLAVLPDDNADDAIDAFVEKTVQDWFDEIVAWHVRKHGLQAAVASDYKLVRIEPPHRAADPVPA